ncbi:LysR family transcriptional regulator [Desulfitobacterium chlororespirans]|uniref:Transcriptional regulator, LysR family n=1 Tax=Desulfitobacterium chlororespirans DSM 11544 TaxID=1121395 RepID=A0A1M7SMN4_9FIRM|nr:LysR family transcriptional regulator [Desulfitobacterium chlororespirans]SHN59736.1 transcriptional regulator, LysR family [Desulfitobacterium chlororespirans DSM 11544]
MQVEYFKYLVDLAETKSLSQTAERFFMTHQAISKAIKKIEHDFSVNLLIRTKKGIELTDAGKIFINKSSEILEKYKELTELLEPFQIEKKQSVRGEFAILTIPKFLEINLPSIITSFYSGFPALNISFKTESHQNILFGHEYNDSTIGLIAIMEEDLQNESFSKSIESRNLKIEVISSSKNILIMHKNSKWVDLDSNNININSIPKIHFGYSIKLLPDNYRGNYIVSNLESMRKLVLNKQGVGILSEFEYKNFFHKSANIFTMQIDETMVSPLAYAYIIKQQDAIPPYMEKFINLFRKFLS